MTFQTSPCPWSHKGLDCELCVCLYSGESLSPIEESGCFLIDTLKMTVSQNCNFEEHFPIKARHACALMACQRANITQEEN